MSQIQLPPSAFPFPADPFKNVSGPAGFVPVDPDGDPICRFAPVRWSAWLRAAMRVGLLNLVAEL
jgi:hypothetical protein